MEFIEFAPAKINLFLDIISKRTDGYHNLGTAFQTIGVGDTLRASLDSDSKITLQYSEAQAYPVEDDLVYKAALLLQKKMNVKQGAKLFLEKKLPIGAGLGGGSADAAAAFRLLNKLWALNLSHQDLETLSLSLGADIPFLVQGGFAFAEGIGEKLTPKPVNPFLKDFTLLLATPHCFVPTKIAYSKASVSGEMRWKQWKNSFFSNNLPELYNKFEESVFLEFPEIQKLKELFIKEGALGALMSGSGSTVFAFFEHSKAAEKVLNKYKNQWRWSALTNFY
ncbi:MAG: 4-(cytidine 5'-diphospho)-2-C-methyl-D-erythritol kinase [Fibrobacter sp.]|nr:4-(cytidine 5'-diphospho)-2-C-methyl-D-erythritol kinase [Fibrobacter sp.]